jgi:N-acetylmuramoyl-L-alanine amidase
VTASHIVKAGEHLGSIARKFGYENFSVLWDHPNNAALKQLRKDPMQLAPGDEVFIPDRVRLVFNRTTAASHDFRVHMDTLTLNLRLLDFDGKPRKNANVLVRVEAPETGAASNASEQTLTTDGEGNLSVEVAPHVADGSIEIDGVVFNLGIGGLDPVDTDSGAAQRLANLGYLVLDDDDLDPTLLRLAIEDFQADNQLQVTGKRADVQAKLLEVYGS